MSLTQIIKELSTYLIGWRGYFGFCQTPSVLRALDEWIRRRLRAIASPDRAASLPHQGPFNRAQETDHGDTPLAARRLEP